MQLVPIMLPVKQEMLQKTILNSDFDLYSTIAVHGSSQSTEHRLLYPERLTIQDSIKGNNRESGVGKRQR